MIKNELKKKGRKSERGVEGMEDIGMVVTDGRVLRERKRKHAQKENPTARCMTQKDHCAK